VSDPRSEKLLGLLGPYPKSIPSTASVITGPTFFNEYHHYDRHLEFMRWLVKRFPNQAETIVAGHSEQGRPITGIHIWGSAGKGRRPAVIFHGTAHAREWISTMTNQYFSWHLLSSYGYGLTKAFVDKYDFYIFPVVNPDGKFLGLQ